MTSHAARTARRGSTAFPRIHGLRHWRSAVVIALLGAGLLAASLGGPARHAAGLPASSGSYGLSALPIAAGGAISRELGGDSGAFAARQSTPGVISFINPVAGLRAVVSDGRITVLGRDAVRVGLSSVAIARGDRRSLPLAGLARARSQANEVQFAAAGVRESLANGPLGLEQTFVLRSRPPGDAPLRITQTISGNAVTSVDPRGDGVTFGTGRAALRYEGLVVTDATGASIPAQLSVAAHRLTIAIDDRNAVYPLRVDPEFEQTAELTAADGALIDTYGFSVAMSGSTIVVGAVAHMVGANGAQGAVYVYTLPSSGGWADATQTAELTASDGGAGDALGGAVAIDGPTIAASALNKGDGAIYVWTMPPGGWAGTPADPLHQTAELSASNPGPDDFGSSLAVSGSTIVAGAYGYNNGAGEVYEWTMPAGGWSGTPASPLEQTAQLTASDGNAHDNLGFSVGVSGTTIVAGARAAAVGSNRSEGEAYVWTRPASGGWVDATETAQLAASNAGADDEFGAAVAVLGSTIVVGAAGHRNPGAVYEWTMPVGGWSGTPGNPLLQTAVLAASNGSTGDELATSVALSGSTIVAGADGVADAGAVYVWAMPDGGWAGTPSSPLQDTAELTADDGEANDFFGGTVAMSGSTIVAGAYGNNTNQGAAYVFHPEVSAATVSLALSPTSIAPDGYSTATATFTVVDTSGDPLPGEAVSIISSAGQSVGPITAGAAPGTYAATITSTTTPGPATITATDLSASPNASATATLTQPPVPATGGATGARAPSNSFTASGSQDGSAGAIALSFDLPGAGTINVLGTHSDSSATSPATTASLPLEPGYRRYATDRATIKVTKAGKLKVMLRLDSAGKYMLRYARGQGWAFHIRVWITYTPTAGSPHTQQFTVRVLKTKHHWSARAASAASGIIDG
jgi:hypothetical protein